MQDFSFIKSSTDLEKSMTYGSRNVLLENESES